MNAPKLRFKEFNDEWCLKTLNELYTFKNGINGDRTQFGKGIKFISVSDILNNNYITYDKIKGLIDIDEKTLLENSVEFGDILFQRSSETRKDIGMSNVYLDSKLSTFGGFVIRGKKNKDNKNNPSFINYLLRSQTVRKDIVFRGAGAQHYNIGQEDLKKVSINIPSLVEQNRISYLLELLDKKIELQTKKIEDLKLLKKGVIDAEFTNSNYDEISLKNILKERKLYSEKGLEYPHVTLSKNGIYDKEERYNRDFLVKSEDKKYKITHLNDLCYNPANLKFGVICLNEYGSAIFSPIYVTFEINSIANPKYIKYYTTRNNFINAIRKYEQGTVYERMAVAPEDFLKFNIKLPDIETQNKIVLKLAKLDKKILLEENKLYKLQELKKGLMQKMFV